MKWNIKYHFGDFNGIYIVEWIEDFLKTSQFNLIELIIKKYKTKSVKINILFFEEKIVKKENKI